MMMVALPSKLIYVVIKLLLIMIISILKLFPNNILCVPRLYAQVHDIIVHDVLQNGFLDVRLLVQGVKPIVLPDKEAFNVFAECLVDVSTPLVESDPEGADNATAIPLQDELLDAIYFEPDADDAVHYKCYLADPV